MPFNVLLLSTVNLHPYNAGTQAPRGEAAGKARGGQEGGGEGERGGEDQRRGRAVKACMTLA